jgi:hypothetical protein
MNALTLRHAHTVPSILANAGENAATKFLEFFAALDPEREHTGGLRAGLRPIFGVVGAAP